MGEPSKHFRARFLESEGMEVADGVADNDTVIQNEADIQKKREVYALKTALRSANGLARYLQIPPMKETTSEVIKNRRTRDYERKRGGKEIWF